MVDENGCAQEHEIQPTEYGDRTTGPVDETGGAQSFATDDGDGVAGT